MSTDQNTTETQPTDSATVQPGNSRRSLLRTMAVGAAGAAVVGTTGLAGARPAGATGPITRISTTRSSTRRRAGRR